MLKFNGKVMKFGNVWGCAGSVTPPEPVPADGVKIGNLIWSKFYADYFNCGLDGNDYVTVNGVGYNFYSFNKLAQMTPQDGWRVPTTADFDNLIAAVGADVTPANWAHLFASHRGISMYDNLYGTGWDEQVGYSRNSTIYYGCAIGFYNSSRIICGNNGALTFINVSSTFMRPPVVFCKDA